MIYTVTLNPAVDYVVHTGTKDSSGLMRSEREDYYAGGKGINVSIVLSELEIPSVALGFVGGFTGEYIINTIRKIGLNERFIKIKDATTRINVKIKGETESEINGSGPIISQESIDELCAILKTFSENDTVIFSGSLPKMPADSFEYLLDCVSKTGCKLIVDASGNTLLTAIKYHPYLIKPNNHELSQIVGFEINSIEDAKKGATQLISQGVHNVLVSLGANGAILVTSNGDSFFSPTPKGVLINSVGAGDSALAGFVSGIIKTNDYSYAVKLAVAAGSATAFSEDLAKYNFIKELFAQL